jgi:hypothetical protein
MNTKVADLSTSYNFHKGCIGFFSLDLNLFECQLWMSPCVWEQWILPSKGVFTIFPSKFEMPLYMKVVSLNKTYNFPEGRILSV